MRTNGAYLVSLLKQEMEKSVPGRNHAVPGVDGLSYVEGSCWALITDSYSHLKVRVQMILPVCVFPACGGDRGDITK